MNLFKSVSSVAESIAVASEKVLKSSASSLAQSVEILDEMSSTALTARKQTKKMRVTLAVDTFMTEASKELESNLKERTKAETTLGKSTAEYLAELATTYGIND